MSEPKIRSFFMAQTQLNYEKSLEFVINNIKISTKIVKLQFFRYFAMTIGSIQLKKNHQTLSTWKIMSSSQTFSKHLSSVSTNTCNKIYKSTYYYMIWMRSSLNPSKLLLWRSQSWQHFSNCNHISMDKCSFSPETVVPGPYPAVATTGPSQC